MIRTGLCSVTLRALPIGEVVEVAANAGLECVEWGADVHVPPGDVAAADTARRLTQAAGLRVAAYGSYYRAGHDAPEDFDAVLASARALGAPRIRIWAGATASANADDAARTAVIGAARDAAARAAADGIEVAFEFHGGTLTDAVGSTLALLAAVEPAATYWQPAEDVSDDDALAALRHLGDRVPAVHVFSWWPGQRRLRLEERSALWRGAFEVLAARRTPVDALLEFVPGDDPMLVAGEAQTLARLIAEVSRVEA